MGLKPDRGVIGALVALFAIWLVFAAGGEAVRLFYVQHLVLRPRLALGWEPWQLLSSGFVNVQLRDVFFVGVSLIFFGNPIEQQLGPRMFWKVFVGGAIGGALAAALLGRLIAPDAHMTGSQPAVTALLMAFGALWGGQQVRAYGVMQMSARTMAWIFVGITAATYLFAITDDWQQALLGLAAMSGAALAGWLISRRGGISVGGSLDKMRMWRLKRRYRVLSGGRDTGGTDKRWLN
ncbi:MAG: rhomboid family intrarane serine protease [bacterium]|nr:rhomboid family intrarane serine protease [bacterium]